MVHVELAADKRNVGIFVGIAGGRVLIGYYVPVRSVKNGACDDEWIGAANAEFFLRGLEFRHDLADLELNGRVVFNIKIEVAFAPFGESEFGIVVLDFVLDGTG